MEEGCEDMLSKMTAGLLAVVLIVGVLGGLYVRTLTDEIDSLRRGLSTVRQDIAVQAEDIETLDGGVEALEGLTGGTAARLEAAGDRIQDNVDTIEAVNAAVQEQAARIARTQAGLADLGSQVDDIAPGMAAEDVYPAARAAVVEISDGERTAGSGFIYGDGAKVVTAYHVVEDLDEIYVILSDGTASTATVTGGSVVSDVAVLALDRPSELAPVVLADSDDVLVGQGVLAIGHPFDLRASLSVGVVSQTDRYAEVEADAGTRWIANLIQFDAPANFGNSGCPLFNAEGQVVGMVVARIGPEVGDGIGYAVSANKLKRVAEAILEDGAFDYPFLGVELGDVTPLDAREAGRDSVAGALVGRILPASPAFRAGLLAGDIITAMNGFQVRDVAALTSYMGEHGSPGGSASITVVRNGTEREVSVTLGSR